jgi:putative copper export protein
MINHTLLLLLQQGPPPEEHATAGKIAREYLGFISFFAVYGALGLHFQVLKTLRAESSVETAGSVVDRADRRAAAIGFVGALLMIVLLVSNLLGRAHQKNISLVDAVAAGGGRQIFQIACLAIFFICFALAAQRMRVAWVIAGVTAIAYAFRNIVTGRWFSNVNPLHETAASLWLGTLAVLALAGLTTAFRKEVTGDERGRLVAEMVSNFSPLALAAAGLLGITGVTTAWRHLKHLDSLWTTPYGYALDAKLCAVAIVVALGAWNWRRMKPTLGDEKGAVAITKSASAELSFAAIVLALTALLVSLPSPGPSGPPPAGGAGRAPASGAVRQ